MDSVAEEDLTENITEQNELSVKEQDELIESIEIILLDIIENTDPIYMHDYDFEKNLHNNIYSNFSNSLDEEEFDSIYYDIIEQLYVNNGMIKRSYKSSYALQYYNDNHVCAYEQIDYLKSVKQPEQRTEEWYVFRAEHITGSNAWKIFSTSESTQNQLKYEKLQPKNMVTIANNRSNMSDNPLNWGHKYEPLTTKLYEYYNDVVVSEFGCIPHKNIPFLAASPDGIVTSDHLNGRMIEIKNVVSREITQTPKMEYWIQMQIQMEVCDLDECDFVETKFLEYETYSDFINDTETYTKGMICVIMETTQESTRFIYEYSPLFENNEVQLDSFSMYVYNKYDIDIEKDNSSQNKVYTWVKNIYWKLETYSNVLVLRNRDWFNQAFCIMKEFWDGICEDKKCEDSYMKYQPKKRIKKTDSQCKEGIKGSIDKFISIKKNPNARIMQQNWMNNTNDEENGIINLTNY